MSAFPTLFSPIDIGPVTVANRIVSTGHHTYLAHEVPNNELIAYHEARAKGGTGLVVTEIIAVHETAMFSNNLLMALDETCIEPYARLAAAVHRHGTKIFGQLFHPGREILSSTDGLIPAAYAPSAVPNERFHIMPQEMSTSLIEEIITGFGQSAGYLAAARYDGVEIVGNQGYLPAQFFNPALNLRTDAYGGDFDRRLAFVKNCIAAIREKAPGLAVGLRISGDELDEGALSGEDVLGICTALSDTLDYFSVVAGTSASLGASVHIVPPMGVEAGYTAPYAAAIKAKTGKPVIATGRINQPQVAEAILASGQSDLCGMTRALIADSAMPVKAQAGNQDEIRACIGCNQSCIGRAHKGLGISCIQNPVSGRETVFTSGEPISVAKKILVIGGGPGGMKAAATASERGHAVTLIEASSQLGGQALLAQRLPGREEFGGIVTNLATELDRLGVTIIKGAEATVETIQPHKPDAIILATGAQPYLPDFEGRDSAHAVTAWDVLSDKADVGASVVIADWRADWIGLGLAERLVTAGSNVTLCTNAAMAGETLQLYTRNHYVGRLQKLGVTIKTHARFFGIDDDTAYFQDTLTRDPIMIEGVDTVVLALGHAANNDLGTELEELGIDIHRIGDCVSPRTAEEAVYEGFMAGRKV